MIKPEDLVPNMILEWTKSDKVGDTEIIKDIEVMGEFTWINFVSGGRINGHVLNEMMILIGVAQEDDIEKYLENKETKSEFTNKPSNIPESIETAVVQPKNTFGYNILDKAKRDSKTDIAINLSFDFISDDKLQMLLELYGDELFESLKSYIREMITEDLLNACIEHHLLSKFPDLIKKTGDIDKSQIDFENGLQI